MDYFKLAVGLARAEGEAVLKRVAEKAAAMQQPGVCACSAIPALHKPGAGNCPATESIARDRHGLH